jgi:hypothetical protein
MAKKDLAFHGIGRDRFAEREHGRGMVKAAEWRTASPRLPLAWRSIS